MSKEMLTDAYPLNTERRLDTNFTVVEESSFTPENVSTASSLALQDALRIAEIPFKDISSSINRLPISLGEAARLSQSLENQRSNYAG